MSQPELSIVIPCYNEASRLPRTLEETVRFFSTEARNVEIVVVSDGSKDQTKSVAESALATLPAHMTSRVIEYHPNRGKGRAIKIGMLEAAGERVLFMDADYSVPLEDLKRAEAMLDTGFDVAMGSRALDGTQIVEHQSFLRERFAKLFGFIQRTYLGLQHKDTQCGFKLFTHDAAQAIFSRVQITSVIFDGEMLWLAKRLGFRATEFPVEWTHDQDTRISYTPMKAAMVLLDMLSIPWRHLGKK